MTDSIDFVVNNLHLFGFCSPIRSIFQTLKLVENSIDALKFRNEHLFRRQIRISLTICDSHSIAVDVADNGCGIIEPDKFIALFKSTKRIQSAMEKDGGGSSTFNGRYGVGLSCALIYSATKVAIPTPMSILTKVHGQKTIDKYEFSVCQETLNIISKCTANIPLQSGDLNAFDSGTKIRIVLGIPNDTTVSLPSSSALRVHELYPEILHFQQYLERLHFLPTANITTEFVIDNAILACSSALIVPTQRSDYRGEVVEVAKTSNDNDTTTCYRIESQMSIIAEQRYHDVNLYKEKFTSNLTDWMVRRAKAGSIYQHTDYSEIASQANVICVEVHFENLTRHSSNTQVNIVQMCARVRPLKQARIHICRSISLI